MAWRLHLSETTQKAPFEGFFVVTQEPLVYGDKKTTKDWLLVRWFAEEKETTYELRVKDYKTNVDIPIHVEIGSNATWQWTWFDAVMSNLPWHEWCELT